VDDVTPESFRFETDGLTEREYEARLEVASRGDDTLFALRVSDLAIASGMNKDGEYSLAVWPNGYAFPKSGGPPFRMVLRFVDAGDFRVPQARRGKGMNLVEVFLDIRRSAAVMDQLRNPPCYVFVEGLGTQAVHTRIISPIFERDAPWRQVPPA